MSDRIRSIAVDCFQKLDQEWGTTKQAGEECTRLIEATCRSVLSAFVAEVRKQTFCPDTFSTKELVDIRDIETLWLEWDK